MKKNPQFIKLFLVMLICTLFIFSSSYFGSLAIGKLKNTDSNSANTGKVVKKTETNAAPVQTVKEEVIKEVSMNLAETPEDLQTILDKHLKIDIPAEATFSLVDFVKKQKLETLSPDTLSMVATGIYQAILPTNFTIDERNIGTELPAYAPLGLEAKVNPAENMDLAFSNPNKTKYNLELQLNGSKLSVTLKGAKLPYNYKISTNDVQQLKPQTVEQYSPLLASGQTNVKSAGKNGQVVNVYRDIYKGEMFLKSELIANDYYPPEYRVVVHALTVPAEQATAAASSSTQSEQTADQTNTNQDQTANTSNTADSSGTSSSSQTTSDNDLWGNPNEEPK